MFKNFKNIIFSFTIILLIVPASVCKANSINNNDVTSQQLKAQIMLFKEALDQFGATSPNQVVELWAKGFKERNGVLQYSVYCDKLKENFIKNRGEAPTSYWIIGVSSPWLQEYEIINNRKLSNNSYEISVKLTWVAVQYNKSEKKTLIIIKEKNKWCIENIK